MSDRQRLIIEMGMGLDLHGQDYTKAARRALEDALHHSALPILKSLDLDDAEIDIRVTVGVQAPDALDRAALRPLFPRGTVTIRAVKGGLDVAAGEGGDRHVVATASVEVFVPRQEGWQLSQP